MCSVIYVVSVLCDNRDIISVIVYVLYFLYSLVKMSELQ